MGIYYHNIDVTDYMFQNANSATAVMAPTSGDWLFYLEGRTYSTILSIALSPIHVGVPF